MEGEQTSTLGPSAPLAWVAVEFPLNSTLQSWAGVEQPVGEGLVEQDGLWDPLEMRQGRQLMVFSHKARTYTWGLGLEEQRGR